MNLTLTLAALLLSAVPVTLPAAVPAKKLNVLFIAVDDLRPQMGCYGDPAALTPHMDMLAGRGTLFERAYCQQAVCNPSRASLLTGLRPDTLRVWDLKTHFRKNRPEVVTLPQHFKSHGYHAECIGKIYHDPRSFRDPASWSVEEKLAFTDEVGGKYALPENLKAYDPAKGRQKAAASECADVPDNAYIDGQVADAAVERLRTLAVQKQPFFLAVGFRRPHLPFSAPKKYWDMQKPERVGRIPNPLPPANVPQIALHDWQELRGYSDIPALGALTPEQVVHLRHGYYAAMSYTDAQIGRVLAELGRTGVRESTVVCLWGDHGWHLGEHGLWGKTTNFELDTRSPLIIAVPGQATAGSRSQSLVEFVDVYPTLIELCNLPPPPHLEGMSLIPVLRDPLQTVKTAAFSQFPRTADGEKLMGCSLRTDRYRLTRWVRQDDRSKVHAVELYDHQADPQENINVANNPANTGLVARLAVQCESAWHVVRKEGNR